MSAAVLVAQIPAARPAEPLDRIGSAAFLRGAAIALMRMRYTAEPALKTASASATIMRACAGRIAPLVPHGCDVVQAGEETFAAIARVPAGSRAVRELIRRVGVAFHDPVRVAAGSVVVTPATGLAVAASDIVNGEQLVARARTALERADAEGQPMVEFTERLAARIARSALVERHLRRAVATNELDLRYQPVVAAATRSVVGMEALLRWRSRELGLVPAREFIAVAEASGYIEHLGDWVFRRAFAAYTSWNVADERKPRLMINISPRQLTQRNFFGMLTSAASAVGMDLRRLDLELTEAAMTTGHGADWSDQLQHLRDRGIRVALDDFGAGYGSLKSIATMPLDVVKLDHAVVRALFDDPMAESIAAAMIALAHSRGLSVVGEGVETPELAAKLTRMGCDALQGYCIARPVSARAAHAFLTQPSPQRPG